MSDEQQPVDLKAQAVQDVYEQLIETAKEATAIHDFNVTLSAIARFAAHATHNAEHFAETRHVHPQLSRPYALGIFMEAYAFFLSQENVRCDLQQVLGQMKPQGEA